LEPCVAMRVHRGSGPPKWLRIAPNEDGWRRVPTPTNQKVGCSNQPGRTREFAHLVEVRVSHVSHNVPSRLPSAAHEGRMVARGDYGPVLILRGDHKGREISASKR